MQEAVAGKIADLLMEQYKTLAAKGGFAGELRAAALAGRNLRMNGLANFEAVCGDGFSAVAGTFDWILTNPPIRAGKAVIYRMFADGAASLLPGGRLWLVIRKQQGAPSAMNYLATLFDEVAVVEKKSGYWVLRCTAPHQDTEEDTKDV